MSNLTLSFLSAIVLGIGATLTFDLWVLFLKQVFQMTPSNVCLVGRWLLYMPEGMFKHSNLVAAPQQRGECTVGWMAHYVIGVLFAIGFVALVGSHWVQHPTLMPAIAFGVITVLAPFLIMQPSFGLGIAGSKTSNPAQARLRSLMNHAAFGIGLYVFGLSVSWLLRVFA